MIGQFIYIYIFYRINNAKIMMKNPLLLMTTIISDKPINIKYFYVVLAVSFFFYCNQLAGSVNIYELLLSCCDHFNQGLYKTISVTDQQNF